MVSKGALVRLDVQAGKDGDVEELLSSALALVGAEHATPAWFGVRFGRGEYGIFDVFADEDGRRAHLAGPVAAALDDRAPALLATAPQVVELDVLADKLPPAGGGAEVTKGLLLTWSPRSQRAPEVADFLRGARALVDDEDGTTAWFAIRLPDGGHGIFDVFPDNRARFAHLTGRVPREIAKRAPSLLGSVPDIDMVDVVAAKLPG